MLRPAPAHGNDPFASLHALGEGLGCRGHGTVASEIGVIFGAEAFDDVGACGLVVGVVQDERISEDSVLAIDIDGGLAGFGLPGAPARLFPRRIYPSEPCAKAAAVAVVWCAVVARMMVVIVACPLVCFQGWVQTPS